MNYPVFVKLRTQFFTILLIAFGSLCILLFLGRQRLNKAVNDSTQIVDNQFSPLLLENAPKLRKTYEGLTALLDAMSAAQRARILQLQSISLNKIENLDSLISDSESSLALLKSTLAYAERSFPSFVLAEWDTQKPIFEQWYQEELKIISLTKELSTDLERRIESRENSDSLFIPFRASIDLLGQQIDSLLLEQREQNRTLDVGTAISFVLNADRDAYQALMEEQKVFLTNGLSVEEFENLVAHHSENLEQIETRLSQARELVGNDLSSSIQQVVRMYQAWKYASEETVSITSHIQNLLRERENIVDESNLHYRKIQEEMNVLNLRIRDFATEQIADFETARDRAIVVNYKLQTEAKNYTQIFNLLALVSFVSFLVLLFFQRRLVYRIIGLSKYLSQLDESNLQIPYSPPKQGLFPARELDNLTENLNGMRLRLVDVIEKHSSALSDLASSEAHFASVFNNHFSPMLLVSPEDGKIFDANEAAAKLYQCSVDELRHSQLSDFAEDSLVKSVLSLTDAESKVIESEQRSKNESTFSAEVYAGLIDHHTDRKALLIIQDITDRMKFEQALLNAKNEAEAANNAKDDFLSVMSHELRTPLNPIIGYAQILRDYSEEEFIQECSTITINAANRMLEIVDSILFFSKINAEIQPLPKTNFYYEEMLEEVVSMIRVQKPLPSVRFKNGGNKRYSIGPDMEFRASLNAVKQILINFFSNALKYGEKSAIVVSLGLKDEPVIGSNRLLISVSDGGPGVPEEHKKDIFKPFTQVDSSISRKNEGLGLGLAICARLAESLEAEIGYDANSPSGSIFWLDCPVTITQTTGTSVDKEDSDPKLQSEPKILLVEDNRDNALYLSKALNTLGAKSFHVFDGESAIEKCKSESFDIAMLDISMQGLDGISTLSRLQQIPDFKNRTRCVAVTAHASQEMEDRCLANGFDSFLRKPVTIDQLRYAIARLAVANDPSN